MSPISDAKPVTDFLDSCQPLCQQVNTAKTRTGETKVELWPYQGLESRVFAQCLKAAAVLEQHQIGTILLRHCDGVCVSYPVTLLQSFRA